MLVVAISFKDCMKSNSFDDEETIGIMKDFPLDLSIVEEEEIFGMKNLTWHMKNCLTIMISY